MKNQYDVIIVGAGFAGIETAKTLAKSSLSVCLIDKTNHHVFQPLLYQVATAALSPANIAYPIREVFKNKPNIKTLMLEVTHIDLPNQVVICEQQKIHYKYLILCPGSRHHYFNHAEWENFAPGLKTLSDALNIRDSILSAFEEAETSCINKELNFVVVGGGPTGVEMAGSIAEVAHDSLIKNYRNIDPSHSKIILVEAGNQLLSGYPKRLSEQTKLDLEKLNVEVKLNCRVHKIDAQGVYLQSTHDESSSLFFIPTHNVIWAAGNQVSPLIKSLNLPSDRMGRVFVNANLSTPGHPNVFILGDCAHYKDYKTGHPLPATAPVAKQMGQFVGHFLKTGAINKDHSFKYKDLGMMATIGKYKAVVLSGPIKCSGILAWLMWGIVHIFFLISFRMKVVVFVEWIYLFFRGQRNSRLIIQRKYKSD